MKAITLHQPWATLIARKVKTLETRSWPAPRALIGQRIAIHAGVKLDVEAFHDFHFDLGQPQGFVIPRGAVVATAELAGVFHIDRLTYVFPDRTQAGQALEAAHRWQAKEREDREAVR